MNKRNYINGEELCFSLKKLYESFGYVQFKMSKFEEYSVYLDNKNFLKSPYAITFTDLNGKLMALKPDVTLSIVKNTKTTADADQKVYYRESVYRPDKTTKEFKEISQMGLEFIGKIDDYATAEILLLAAKSLEAIDGDFVLDVSHLGVLTGLLQEYNAQTYAAEIYAFISSKNTHDLIDFCNRKNIDQTFAKKVATLAGAKGNFRQVLEVAKKVATSKESANAVNALETIFNALQNIGFDDKIRLDFSIVNDGDYYNGIVFQGYVGSSAYTVLTGGRYDKLVGKFVNGVSAMGFAVYLDELPLGEVSDGFDGDALVLYGADTDVAKVLKTVQKYAEQGKKVCAAKSVPQNKNFKTSVNLQEK